MTRQSTFKAFGLPDAVVAILTALGVIFALAPYIANSDLGVLKIPKFDPPIESLLKRYGWVGIIFICFLFIPLWKVVPRPSRKERLRLVWESLRYACRTALRMLEDDTLTLTDFYLLLRSSENQDFEDLLDEWAKIEKVRYTEDIKERLRGLAKRYREERGLSPTFRTEAAKVIEEWKTYFDGRLQ